MGFTRDQVELILSSAMSGDLSRCLDWAVLNIEPQFLPPGLTDKDEHKQPKTEAVTFVPKSKQPEPKPKKVLLAPPSITESSKTTEVIATENHLKNWILSSMENDDEPSKLPTNVEYALLKHTLKDNPQNRDLMAILQMERDFNPRIANDELAKLVKEEGLAQEKKKERKKEKRKNEVVEEGDGAGGEDLFGALFECSDFSAPVNQKECPTVFRDMAYDNWTGKSPKQYFMDYLSKNAKGTKAKFSQIIDNLPGFRYRVALEGGPFANESAEMSTYERVADAIQAQHYVSTKLLYSILPNLPIYRSLPPPYRELWLELIAVKEKIAQDSASNIDQIRQQFIAKLYDSIISLGTPPTPKPPPVPKPKKLASFTSSKDKTPFSAIASYYTSTTQASTHKKMASQRSKLPIYGERSKIITSISENSTVIISSATGSGKSTQVPQFIFEDSCTRGEECMIVCTQPRRISAISLSERVGEESCMNGVVGYQVRGESNVGKDSRIVYMTTGILLRIMQGDGELTGITHVIVDEVHERSVDSDFLLILLRRMQRGLRKDIKVILMSATAESQKFANYFGNGLCVDVPGRTFPVSGFFLEDAVRDTGYIIEDGSEFALLNRTMQSQRFSVSIGSGKKTSQTIEWEVTGNNVIDRIDPTRINLDLCEDLVRYLHINGADLCDVDGDKGAILVFLPGFGEIKRMHERLSFDAQKQGVVIIPLHSMLGSGSQKDVFKSPPRGMRKIVLSTNIAETGITIPDVTYVIDTCRANQISYDTHKHISRLSQVFISKASCLQRRGRAGRMREGMCYHLITKKHYESLPSHQVPEIMRVPLEELILSVAATIGTNVNLVLAEALDPPPPKHVERSLQELVRVGALVMNGPEQQLTTLGSVLVNFPMDVRLGKMLLVSIALECLDPCLTIAAALSLGKTPFNRPFGSEQEADRARHAFKKDDSDLIMIHAAYSQWRDACLNDQVDIQKFCDEKFLSRQNLGLIEDTRQQLLRLMISTKSVGKDVYASKRNRGVIETQISSTYTQNDGKSSAVLASITAGLYPNILRVVPEGVPDRPIGLVLESTGSAGFAFPHKNKSAYSDTTASKNTWFVYHLLSRIEGKTGSKLCVWDLTRVSGIFAFIFSNNVTIDHRQGMLTFDNAVTISCPARSAVALDHFRRQVHALLEKGIVGQVFSRSEASIISLFFQLIKEDLNRDKLAE